MKKDEKSSKFLFETSEILLNEPIPILKFSRISDKILQIHSIDQEQFHSFIRILIILSIFYILIIICIFNFMQVYIFRKHFQARQKCDGQRTQSDIRTYTNIQTDIQKESQKQNCNGLSPVLVDCDEFVFVSNSTTPTSCFTRLIGKQIGSRISETTSTAATYYQLGTLLTYFQLKVCLLIVSLEVQVLSAWKFIYLLSVWKFT